MCLTLDTLVVLPVSSINAFVDKAHETSRLLLEGERVLEAGHMFSCSIKKLNKECYTFIGFVFPMSALTSDQHELEITLNGKVMSCTDAWHHSLRKLFVSVAYGLSFHMKEKSAPFLRGARIT
ncbi:hypothetical protein HPB47_000458 [Ixodes persulcatus]|uniref:Uncharacterized protein n=1 Tax=Ixodes persulcatus TaxID=34615 RepID=A0AC60PT20_IXOPE|nr:hypothetical protein HPB47_000458 [Ixodes persulcatus]